MLKIIQRGAEAVLYLDNWNGKKVLVKERIKKGYRIPELDEKIRKQRTKREAKLIETAEKIGVPTPKIFEIQEFKIIMEWIDGKRVKDVLNNLTKKKREEVCKEIGKGIFKLHSNGIIHGDLTTSNFLLKENKIYFIDFGLGKFSSRIEDQAVDLFLLFEALRSTHFKFLEECWENVLKGYKKYPKFKEVLKRIEKIQKRVRYAK